MDDTTQSRVSDVGTSAATRKRRSSILKSQRPARTPFSELEFNVATPTDTAKSRRVSFSRRTGVAEFVTNEATTTWKNFYEEHNKSLESSGNDSGAKQPVGHLGKRIFDQQFEVCDAADFIDSANPTSSNFEHLISLNTTDKLTAPQNKFELSALTDQQRKIFGNDFTVPTMGDLSGVIRVNFSTIKPVGDLKDYNDDLDEIQKDIQQGPNIVCVGPFSGRPSMSEYIEVDLNTTTVAVHNEVCDMSITDTIHSPKVQDVSKSCSIDKNKDWVVDKENIAVNPYAAPRESLNFAVNDEPDEVLVFDGKRLTIQLEKPTEKSYQNTLPETAPQRKTIVLNTNDDLPNFAEDLIKSDAGFSNSIVINRTKDFTRRDDIEFSVPRSQSNTENEKRKTIVFDNGADISITQSVPIKIVERRRTVVYDNEDGNISMTQVLPPNILVNEEDEKAKTIVFDENCDISMTQAITSNIIMPEKSDKRRTIIFEEDQGNISVTQVLPTNIASEKIVFGKRQTIVFEDNNVSVTQAIPTNIIMQDKQEKRKTVVFDTDSGDISVTQAIPSNIIVSEKRKTIVFDDNQGDISVTQALPLNILPESSEKRRTIIFDDNECNISVTQAIPNIMIQKSPEKQISMVFSDNKCNVSVTQAILSDIYNEKRNDIVFNDDVSFTQGIPSNIIPEKRKTIVFEDNQGDISVTQAIPSNILQNMTQHEDNNMSITEALPINIEAKDSQSEENELKVVQNDTISNQSQEVDKETAVNVILFKESCDIRNSSYDSVRISTTQSLPINITFKDVEEKQITQTSENLTTPKVKKLIKFEVNTLEEVVSVNNKSLNDVNVTELINKTVAEVAEVVDNDKPVHPVTDYLLKNLDSNLDQRAVHIENIQNNEEILATVNAIEEPPRLNTNNTIIIKNDIEISKEKQRHINLKYENVRSKPIPVDLIAIQEHLMKTSLKEDTQVNLEAIVFQAKVTADTIDSNKDVANFLNDIASSNDVTSMKSPTSLHNADGVPVVSKKDTSVDKSISSESPFREMSDVSTFSMQTAGCQTSLCYDSSGSQASVGVQSSLPQHKDADANLQIVDNKSSVTTGDKASLSAISNESMFYITHDTDEDEKDDVKNTSLTKKDLIQQNDETGRTKEQSTKTKKKFNSDIFSQIPRLEDVSSTSLRLVRNQEMPVGTHIEDRLEDLEYSVDEEEFPINSYYDQILREKNDSFRKANDTNELLDLISDFTDKTKCESMMKEKSEMNDTKKLSFAPQRQSIVFSREDLMNNISMAQAALQQSRQDDSDLSTEELNYDSDYKHADNNEVVKTLNFDESMSDRDLKSTIRHSPIKKTAFGETSYMTEAKGRVIPSYLKDVSDGIKELMLDLVKPIPDVLPFDGNLGKSLHRSPSTNSSKQIQANLITSSQIDIQDLKSDPVSLHDVTGKSPSKNCSESSKVIVFDHENPLNNILLGPIQYSSSHEYDPIDEASNSDNVPESRDNYNRFVSRHYHVKTDIDGMQGDVATNVANDAVRLSAGINKVPSIDQSVNVNLRDVTDCEVNTLIAMKGNKELLDASSSLTLVDEPYRMEVEDLPPVSLFMVNTDDANFSFKGHKRVYSPANKNPNIINNETTPKPSTKVLKVSNSPSGFRNLFDVHLTPELHKQDSSIKGLSPKSEKTKGKSSKHIHDLTVQQLNYNTDNFPTSEAPLESESTPVPASITDSLDNTTTDSSFSSSTNLKSLVPSSFGSTANSVTSHNWHPEVNSTSSRSDTDSSSNVVARIDMLNFMGSHECEWESSPSDRWSFRLLHGRIRVLVRLAHRMDNATRTIVRGDTPVIDTTAEPVQLDKNNSVAALCIQFACQTMSHIITSRAPSHATDIPSLLRRCAAVARVALKWGQAMHNAKLHLAYTLDSNGHLTLKVANIPLRSVWEVSMDLKLQISDTPWPRASDVRVRRVVSDVVISQDDVNKLMDKTPLDWGHVPRMVWSVFRFLKHKSRDEDLLLGTWAPIGK